MKIAIAGITGFIGQKLEKHLSEQGHHIVPVTRYDFRLSPKQLAQYLKGCDAIVNLSGAPVIKRWTESYKQEILKSRTDTTRVIVNAMAEMNPKPKVFVNASAIGIYDYKHINDEYSDYFGSNFLTTVVKKWEKQAAKAKKLNIRTCIARFGVVLGKDGGAFPTMVKPFKFFVGGKIGSGKQVMSYIHINDLIRGLEEMITNNAAVGVYNLVAPTYCTNREFTRTLSKALGRPALFTVPEFALKLLYGNAAEVVIGGEKVKPTRLEELGFKFNYPDIQLAIDALI